MAQRRPNPTESHIHQEGTNERKRQVVDLDSVKLVLGEHFPCNGDGKTGQHTGKRAGVRSALPQQKKDHLRTDRGAEDRPSVILNELKNRDILIQDQERRPVSQ